MEHIKPSDIERTSMAIIESELQELGLVLRPGTEHIVKRVIHTTADFSYAENLYLSDLAVDRLSTLIAPGSQIITDTNMAKAGVNQKALGTLGASVTCYMADPQIAEAAKAAGTTRAVMSMRRAAEDAPTWKNPIWRNFDGTIAEW